MFHVRTRRRANGDDIAGIRFPDDHCGWRQFRLSPCLRERPWRKTDFPPHIKSASPACRDAVHLAFASAAFGEIRGGAAPARGFSVSFLESALVRFDVRAGIPASDRHSLQLGVRSDHLPRAAAAAARWLDADRDGGTWRKSRRPGWRTLRHRCRGRPPRRDRRASGGAGAAGEGYRDRHYRACAGIRRLHNASTDRSPHQPPVSGSLGSRRGRAGQRPRRQPDRGDGRPDRRQPRGAARGHRAAAGSARGGRGVRDPRQPRILLRLPRMDGPLRLDGDARARERPRGSRAWWRQTGACRRHRPIGVPLRPTPLPTSPPH